MDSVWTEEEIEYWLQTECRMLLLPDGRVLPFADFRLTWEALDELVVMHGYSEAQILTWALEETQLSGEPFEVTFPAVVTYLDRHLRPHGTAG